MNTIGEVLETAHITLSTATLKVVVNDISKFETLLNPRKKLISAGSKRLKGILSSLPVYEIDVSWQKEMGFPSYVLDVSPNYNDNTLLVWVTDMFDFKEISDWLKKFE